MSGQTAIVTGAGSGIGRAVARALLDGGWNVLCVGRRGNALAETVDVDCPGTGSYLEADVSDPGSVNRMFSAAVERLVRLDLLVNNAGTHGSWVPFEDLSTDDWLDTVAVNLTGYFLCARAAYRVMKAQSPAGGRIINNGSVSALAPRPRSAPYTASKHGVTGLTRAISLEGRPHGIVCSQIDLGNVATEMTGGIATGVLQADMTIRAEPTFDVAVAARFFVQVASLPADVDLQFATLAAAGMPLVGRG
jgi:NAD(P)-dependent dehydrogenase (short-subunit alcohol dehydrogenase family)